eukprot:TRINITY_DN43391_c0_g1_i1.p1 TRINITY_DN43391_c0_g1~~TRINITY_DN43391_c0_g1_i1.p1  ORF type:complete len:442 (+),score=151.79 TRINITY_DN43391_c0_g1_i1:82-1326(+)
MAKGSKEASSSKSALKKSAATKKPPNPKSLTSSLSSSGASASASATSGSSMGVDEKAACVLAMEEAARQVKVEPCPEGWPENTVPNVRAFMQLPKGWHHAKRLTSGGNLHPCYVNDDGSRLFWHRKDLEKHLGVTLEAIPTRRPVSPEIEAEFGSESIIRRTGVSAGEGCVLERCKKLDGKTVAYALLQFKYKKNVNGESKLMNYNVGDLRYDIKYNRLRLEGDKAPAAKATAKAKGRAKPKSSALGLLHPLRALKGGNKNKAAKSSAAGSQKVVSKISKMAKSKAPAAAPKAAAKARTQAVKKEPASSSRAPPRRGSSVSDAASSSEGSMSKAALAHLRTKVLQPLLRKAAGGGKGDLEVGNLVTAAKQLGMEGDVVSLLPAALKAPVSKRSEFQQLTLRHFTEKLDAAIRAA